MKILSAAILAASLLAGATVASAGRVENVSVRVSTAGVNFNDPASVNKFRARVQHEVALACNPGDRVGADVTPDFACRKSMGMNAETRVAQLQGRSNQAYTAVGE